MLNGLVHNYFILQFFVNDSTCRAWTDKISKSFILVFAFKCFFIIDSDNAIFVPHWLKYRRNLRNHLFNKKNDQVKFTNDYKIKLTNFKIRSSAPISRLVYFENVFVFFRCSFLNVFHMFVFCISVIKSVFSV